jgi:hypothetical protein
VPYPNAHLYLTWHWTQNGALAEQGQCGFRFDSTAPASQLLVDNCATAVQAFWTAATSGIESAFLLSYIRLASIGTNGLYVPGTVAYDHTFAGVNGGGGAIPGRFPLQISMVSSLRTALPRGRAHAGRVYLPWFNNALQSDFTWQGADGNNRSNTLASRLHDLNLVMPGPLSIFSKVSTGFKNPVTQVVTGRKPDTQRRRARQIPEVYGIPANV